MIAPTIPVHEHERIKTLEELNILDTLSEEEFDNVVELAASICEVPISLVSLVDRDRQWFKAKKGLDASQTPRDLAFCAHAINEPESIFEVENALLDRRFEDNPLVTGDPNIRFYAGAPLVTSEGHALGTLCVIDRQPRQLTEKQKKSLDILSHQVTSFIEKRKALMNENERLISEKEEAEAAGKLKEDFLSNVSHEIRTPLNAIIGSINLLEIEDPQLSENKKFKLLKFGSDNLLSLINDVLDYQKIAAGKLEIDEQDFDLQALVTNLTESWKPAATNKDIRLSLKYDNKLNRNYQGDRVRLVQILNNLISNAVKFTDEGMVSLSVRKEKDQVKFEVKDTGVGMPEDKIQTIFEDYGQIANQSTNSIAGTGLGLTISQKLVNLMDGIIEVKSEEGFGSVFHFSIPLKEVPSSISEEKEQAPDEQFSNALRVLLVEDNAGNRIIATSFLKNWGMSVDVAVNGEEAVDKVQQEQYDVVLMDLRMPKMDGIEATEAIRNLEGEYYKTLPIIAMTASVAGEVMHEIEKVSMNGYVSKPFDPNEFQRKLAEVTDSNRVINEEEPDLEQDFKYLKSWLEGDNEKIKKVANATVDAIEYDLNALLEGETTEESVRMAYHNIKPNLYHIDLGYLYEGLPEYGKENFDEIFLKEVEKIKKELKRVYAKAEAL